MDVKTDSTKDELETVNENDTIPAQELDIFPFETDPVPVPSQSWFLAPKFKVSHPHIRSLIPRGLLEPFLLSPDVAILVSAYVVEFEFYRYPSWRELEQQSGMTAKDFCRCFDLPWAATKADGPIKIVYVPPLVLFKCEVLLDSPRKRRKRARPYTFLFDITGGVGKIFQYGGDYARGARGGRGIRGRRSSFDNRDSGKVYYYSSLRNFGALGFNERLVQVCAPQRQRLPDKTKCVADLEGFPQERNVRVFMNGQVTTAFTRREMRELEEKLYFLRRYAHLNRARRVETHYGLEW